LSTGIFFFKLIWRTNAIPVSSDCAKCEGFMFCAYSVTGLCVPPTCPLPCRGERWRWCIPHRVVLDRKWEMKLLHSSWQMPLLHHLCHLCAITATQAVILTYLPCTIS
jgi:hypothetical protein